MTDAEQIARGIRNEFQDAVAAKDHDRLSELVADEVVLFGTAAANLDRDQTMTYLARVLAQEGPFDGSGTRSSLWSTSRLLDAAKR